MFVKPSRQLAIFGKPPEAVLHDRKHRRGNSSNTTAVATTTPTTLATPATLDYTFIESAAIALTKEELDYFSYTAIPSSSLPIEHYSVDWSIYGLSCDVAAPLTLDAPYFFDSGSSCHISPSHDDQVDFTPITPRAICSINGSAVYAHIHSSHLGQPSLQHER
ncbi:hypothetical protein EW146_g8837 [Bondarzewia mesenterica]|uniref:Uncharacterized protein n=1 Tax=Bondarzewia mesenterica TaxID=1095465 RepID=A0A4S4LB69_9AGAM|nr:hypothetical protein EW146_g8837 [Bondarzewia mesenterica]